MNAPDNRRWVEAAHRGLALVWIDFESALVQVPIVARMLQRKLRIEDYRSLLLNLRQQVMEGGRWISRGASHLGQDHEELRTLFIRHAAAEHRDYRMLEANYVAVGGDLDTIRGAEKNIGSAALSAFLYQTASQPDPVAMLGAMFIIEGLGNTFAGPWSDLIADQLDLGKDAISFLKYHGENDADHLEAFGSALAMAVTSEAAAQAIVKTAKVVARLYRLQLEELDNV